MRTIGVFPAALVAATFASGALAQESRTFRAIPTPPPGAESSRAAFVPIDPRLIEAAVTELFAAWNTSRLRELLTDDYYEGLRIVDTLISEVPRDAILRVLSIESMSTLEQRLEAGGAGKAPARVSTVSVIVRSQLEFNDPERGFRRLEGLNEYVFEVREEVQ